MNSGKIGRFNFRHNQFQTFLFCFFLFSVVFPFNVGHCANVTLAWDPVNNSQLEGYSIYYGTSSKNYQWVVDVGNVTTYTLTNLTIGTTYYAAATAFTTTNQESAYSNEVQFTVPSCTYTVSPLSASYAASGGSGSVTITTPTYCNWTTSSGVSWITVNTGTGLGNGTMSYSVASNTAATSRSASLTIGGNVFTINQAGAVVNYTISASSGTGGTISPSGQVSVQSGTNQTFSITSNNSYKIANVTVDGVSQGAVGSYAFSNVQANHTISASFSAITYNLTTSKGGTGSGTVTNSPSGSSFTAGTVVTLTASPDANSSFAGWSGACSGTSSTCQVTMTSDLSVTATFNAKTYNINATAGTGGTISPSGQVSVTSGGTQAFTISPNNGFKITDVSIDGASQGAIGSYAFSNVQANRTISASFAAITYNLTTSKGGTGSGTVTNSPSGSSFTAGTVVTLTASPDANSSFAGWSGACSGTSSTCQVTMTSDLSVTATFNAKTYNINATAGTGGTISPSGQVSVTSGGTQAFTISPNNGFKITDVSVDGASQGAIGSYAFSNVQANRTISASFAAITYNLTTSKGGTGSGTVTNSPSGSSLTSGTVVTLTASPDANSTFAGWSGACSGTSSTCQVTMTSDLSVTATFNAKTYNINATAGTGGTISPSGQVSVTSGGTQAFTISPNNGFKITDVSVDGASQGAIGSYAFSNVQANRTISASFAAITYNLTTSKGGTGSGTVTNSPSGSSFTAGTVVTLTTSPDANSSFAGWSGACSGTSSTCQVTMTSDLSVTATFNAKTYNINATAGTGGTISPSGQVSVTSGGTQAFTISPNNGFKITDVSVDGASQGAIGSYAFSNVKANRTISASFAAITYNLTTSKGGTGSGTVTNSPSGSSFTAGTVVTLTTSPDANSTFAGWSGACSGTSSTCQVTMNANQSVTATFNIRTYTINASADTGGSISPSGQVSTPYGGTQNFTITPGPGYTIASVTVDGVSQGAIASYGFTNVQAGHTISASFSPVTYNLTLNYSGTGSGTVSTSPSGSSFAAGTVVTLTASPNIGSTFAGWSGDCSGTSSTCQVTMTSDLSVTAIFYAAGSITRTINASASGSGTISPAGSVSVNDGTSTTFIITPNRRHKIINVNVDGVWKGPISSYTLNNVTANHSIKAYFR